MFRDEVALPMRIAGCCFLCLSVQGLVLGADGLAFRAPASAVVPAPGARLAAVATFDIGAGCAVCSLAGITVFPGSFVVLWLLRYHWFPAAFVFVLGCGRSTKSLRDANPDLPKTECEWANIGAVLTKSFPAGVPLFTRGGTLAGDGHTLVDRADTQDTAVVPTVTLRRDVLKAKWSYSAAPDPVRNPVRKCLCW
eukprot:5980452-Amphidinium_carterae.1